MRLPSLLVALTFLTLGTANAQTSGITWGPAPAVFPAGAKLAVLQGDPGKAGEYTVRLDMPDGYKIPPHFHPTAEHVTVIQGNLLIGIGDKLDPAQAKSLPAGGFISAEPNMHHFAIAKGHTVVQVHGGGPFVLTYVNPKDDPSQKPKTD